MYPSMIFRGCGQMRVGPQLSCRGFPPVRIKYVSTWLMRTTINSTDARSHLLFLKRLQLNTISDRQEVRYDTGRNSGSRNSALIGRPIRKDRGALLMQPHGHTARSLIPYHSFEREKAPSTHNGGFDRCTRSSAPGPRVRQGFCEASRSFNFSL